MMLFERPVRCALAYVVLLVAPYAAFSQCTACTADPSCSSDNGFPTICPASLPAAMVGSFYEETITFFLPAEVVDPGSGVTADLNSVTITAITGVPLGMQVELDDDDAVYYPTNGQTLGCANICGSPLLAGTYDMVISISAVASAFGIEQVVTDSFPYQLVVEAGEGGNASFTYSPPSGCDSLLASFEASLSGIGSQITNYSWDFGNGTTAASAAVDSVMYSGEGSYDITLTTTISDQMLSQITLSTTAGGGWDDGWSPSPDPYFVISDAGGGNVYTSSVANETYSNTWSNVNLILTNPPYTVTFWDDDLFPDDDYLGSMTFVPNGAGTIDLNADPSYGSLTILLQMAVSTSDTSQVVVNGSPQVGIAWNESGDSLIAAGQNLIDYAWYWGDSLVATGADSVFAPVDHGWYRVAGTSSAGCVGMSDSLLYCAPDATFALNLSLGELPEVVAADVEFDVSAWVFVWTFNGAASDTLQGVANWPTDASGWYAAEAWDSYGCPWVSDSVLVCWPLSTPWIEEDENGLLSVAQSFALYQWWVDGEPIPGATEAVYQTTGPGLYAVTATDFADCPGVISEDWLVVKVLETAHTSADLWTIYPNPTAFELKFDLPSEPGGFTVQVFSLNGTLVETATVHPNEVMDVSLWAPGSYILRVQSRNTGAWLPAVRVIKQ
jgi:hypothetical protein